MKRSIYVALIDDGLRTRGFRDLKFMCEVFGLDYYNVRAHIKDKGYWAGLKYSIFAVEMESRQTNKGRER